MSVLTAILCLLVVLATSRTACGTITYPMTLDLRERVIAVESAEASCRGDPLCELPARAIDGNLSTSWNSPIVEGGGSVNLSLELGQEYRITSLLVELPFLPPTPPPRLDIHHSSDGVDFQPGAALTLQCPGRERAVCIVNDLLGAYNLALHQTQVGSNAFLKFQFSQQSPANLNVSIAELGVVVECGSPLCPECGACADRHLVTLEQLSRMIVTANASIPAVSVVILVNETELARIQNLTRQSQDSALDWLLRLIAAERVVGLPSQYPPNTTLPPHIQQLENNFNDTILNKLSLLMGLTSRTEEFSALSNSTATLLVDVRELVRRLQEVDVAMLSNDTNELLTNLSSLLNDLNQTNLAALVTRSNSTLSLISSRSFTLVILRLANLSMQLERFSNLSSLFVSGQGVEEELINAFRLLRRVSEISQTVIVDGRNVSSIAEQVRERITQIQQNLFPQASMLFNITKQNIEGARLSGDRARPLLSNGSLSTQAANSSLQILQQLTDDLEMRVTNFRRLLNPLLLPSNSSCLDVPGEACFEAELHARALAENFTRINSTRPALEEAESFLAKLRDLPNIDFANLNRTALDAILIGNEALQKLEASNSSGLLRFAVVERNTSQQVFNEVSGLVEEAENELTRAQQQFNRSQAQLGRFQQLMSTVAGLNQTVMDLEQTPDFAVEARRHNTTAGMTGESLRESRLRVEDIERRLPTLEEGVRNLTDAVHEANRLLNRTENIFPQIEELLRTTGPLANSSTEGLDDLMQRNTVLLSEMDELIRSVSETHDLIKKINTPVIMPRDGAYISLQPPPTSMTDQIQFENLDIHLGPEPGLMAPNLLFYAGPAVNSSRGGNRESLSSDDFLAITSTTGGSIQVQWRLGNSSGFISQNYVISSLSEIFVTRVGTQFELQASAGLLGSPARSGMNQNCSLLFHTTANTVYYIGGSPEGVELADQIPPMYNSFIGRYQLILFRGELWTMWDYRSRSNTESATFVSNTQISNHLWLPSRGDFSLSFDGEGYVKPTRFTSGFAPARGLLDFRIRARSTEGLVAFLYEPQRSVSVEVAYKDRQLHSVLKWSGGEISHIVPMTANDLSEQTLTIVYNAQGVRFTVGNDEIDILRDGFMSLRDFSQVQAWFGGVQESMLTAPFVPSVTNTSFQGCLTIGVSTPGSSIFTGDSFKRDYLNSNVQKRVSGTCLKMSHVSELGFNGTGHLVYQRLMEVIKPSEDPKFRMVNPGEQFTLALSFWPEAASGVMIVSRSTSRVSMRVTMEEGQVIVTMQNGTDPTSPVTLTSPKVALGAWHHLLIDMRFMEQRDNVRLFVDNKLVNATQFHGLVDFIISDTPNPPLEIGGMNSSSLPNFRGCMKNLAYNYETFSFLNGALTPESFNASGVTFNKCPFFNARSAATVLRLPLSPPPTQEQTCFARPSERLDGTHGGFHADTQLLSGNIIGLDAQSWNLSFSFRRSSAPALGRILTMTFAVGEMIILSVGPGGGTLIITVINGGTVASNDTILLTSMRSWIGVVLQCRVAAPCNVSVTEPGAATPSTVMTAVPSVGSSLIPQLPLVFGRYERGGVSAPSFVGCLRDLQINGDPAGFSNRTTCVSCFSDIETADGFSGASYIRRGVSPTSQSVSFQFRAAREHGLVLLLTSPTGEPAFGMGLYEGEMRVTNFSSFGFVSFSGSFCNTSTPAVFHTLTLTINNQSVAMELDTATMTVGLKGSLGSGNPKIYIGGLPGNFTAMGGTPDFSFLLSTLTPPSTLPPNFVGCVRELTLSPPAMEVASEGVQTSYCPSPPPSNR